MLVCMVSIVCCIWVMSWVSWSTLSWEAIGEGGSDDELEFFEVDVAQIKGSKILCNLLDRGEWTQMDSWCAI